jgi:hypothetical protein
MDQETRQTVIDHIVKIKRALQQLPETETKVYAGTELGAVSIKQAMLERIEQVATLADGI